MKLKEKTILTTGGASGIGFLMCRMALERGARSVVIWDVNQANMDKAVAELSPLGKVYAYQVDVTSAEQIAATHTLMQQEGIVVDVLINCAGIVRGNATFDKQTLRDIDLTMAVNALAPMYVAREFLPEMLERHSGHICNIASAAGLIANPRMSVYAASKWAAIGWSESMRIELQESKSGVRVTTVTPYYINTGMFDGVRSRVLPILKPERVAHRVLRAIERNKIMLGMPLGYHFIRICQAIMPLRWFDVFAKMLGVYSTMDNFTGRKEH